jgi:hypothetical protein
VYIYISTYVHYVTTNMIWNDSCVSVFANDAFNQQESVITTNDGDTTGISWRYTGLARMYKMIDSWACLKIGYTVFFPWSLVFWTPFSDKPVTWYWPSNVYVPYVPVAFRDRLRQTTGVVFSRDSSCVRSWNSQGAAVGQKVANLPQSVVFLLKLDFFPLPLRLESSTAAPDTSLFHKLCQTRASYSSAQKRNFCLTQEWPIAHVPWCH